MKDRGGEYEEKDNPLEGEQLTCLQGEQVADILTKAESWTGHVEVAKLLLGAGADVNAAGGQYTTALITASARGHVELAKLLLGAGADVNAAGGHYGTALISAYRSGHREVIKLLRERGAVS
ncbi:ankyrin [Athelia psychrophila]|uniref:Ankyrin n=1 Tax=Athelia psychrophila TaxID=1759441 RepID=A0A165ZHN6_9AGAM|nr:ankyrin [Fibularhizoctonia sp. CBS 109695]